MSKKTRTTLTSLATFVLLTLSAHGAARAQGRAPQTLPAPQPETNNYLRADTESQPVRDLGVSLAGNVLAFRTVEDYRRVVDNPSEEVSAKFRAALKGLPKFQSYLASRRGGADSAFADDYFASMLNPDQVVQIGAHLFRVNPAAKKVFVLPAAKSAEYKDLVAENTANRNIAVYSTDDDVLDILAGKVSPGQSAAQKTFGLFCNEGGVGSAASQINFKVGNNNYQTLAAFNNYGIYYSLFAQVTPSLGSNQFLFEFNNGYGYIHWHARCGSTADYGTTTSGTPLSSMQRFQSYQASKNLSNFFFGYRILLKSNNAPLTGMNVIRKNW